jgi:hypothetical protein
MSSEMARRRLTASFIRRGLNSGWRWLRVVRLRIVAPTADRHVDFADIKAERPGMCRTCCSPSRHMVAQELL